MASVVFRRESREASDREHGACQQQYHPSQASSASGSGRRAAAVFRAGFALLALLARAAVVEAMRRLTKKIEVFFRVIDGRSPAAEADPHRIGAVAHRVDQVRHALHEGVPTGGAGRRGVDLDLFFRGALPDLFDPECDFEPAEFRGLVWLDASDLAREDRIGRRQALGRGYLHARAGARLVGLGQADEAEKQHD